MKLKQLFCRHRECRRETIKESDERGIYMKRVCECLRCGKNIKEDFPVEDLLWYEIEKDKKFNIRINTNINF